MTNEMTAAQALAWMAQNQGREVKEGDLKYKIGIGEPRLLVSEPDFGGWSPTSTVKIGTYTPVKEEPPLDSTTLKLMQDRVSAPIVSRDYESEIKRYPVTPETLGQFERVVVEDPRYLKNPVYSRVNNRWLKWEWIQIQLAFTNGLQCYSTEPPRNIDRGEMN